MCVYICMRIIFTYLFIVLILRCRDNRGRAKCCKIMVLEVENKRRELSKTKLFCRRPFIDRPAFIFRTFLNRACFWPAVSNIFSTIFRNKSRISDTATYVYTEIVDN